MTDKEKFLQYRLSSMEKRLDLLENMVTTMLSQLKNVNQSSVASPPPTTLPNTMKETPVIVDETGEGNQSSFPPDAFSSIRRRSFV